MLKDRRQNTKDYEAQVAFTAYTFEKTVLTMDPANLPARAFYDRLGFVELPSGALGISTD